jgi:hypothetical protein
MDPGVGWSGPYRFMSNWWSTLYGHLHQNIITSELVQKHDFTEIINIHIHNFTPHQPNFTQKLKPTEDSQRESHTKIWFQWFSSFKQLQSSIDPYSEMHNCTLIGCWKQQQNDVRIRTFKTIFTLHSPPNLYNHKSSQIYIHLWTLAYF